MPFYPHKDYAWWVIRQLQGDDRTVTPSEMVRRHADGWRDVFNRFVAAGAPIELPALVVSRWEYLGSLYLGSVENRTDVAEAVAFCDRFLTQVNGQYQHVHNLAGRVAPPPGRSDFFTMFRNKPLHGLNPAPIHAADGSGVVAWWIGTGITDAAHLTVDPFGKLHLNEALLSIELVDVMKLYADYLDANTDWLGGNYLPQERWLRAGWARFRPHEQPWPDWLALGQPYGVPV